MKRLAVLLLCVLACLPRSGAAQSTTNYPLFFPLVTLRQDLRPPPVKLAALLYDPVTPGEPDEAVQLYNPGRGPAELTGWSLSDGTRRAVFPGLTLAPGVFAWCAYNAPAFQASFGFPPDCEYGPDSGAGLPRLDGVPPRFSNAGGSVTLSGPDGGPTDLLVYKAGPVTWGWQGPTVSPWRGTGLPEEGQILTRKRDEATGRPLADTNTAADWASDPSDPVVGRRVWYPAWDPAALRPLKSDTPASFRLALAPDIAFYIVRDVITAATTSITLALYSFDHPALADLLAERLAAGVRVTILLEGAPAGGLDDQQRWAATRVAQAGGRVLYMSNHLGGVPRYRNQHAKVALVDGRRLLLSTENWSPDSMPDDDKSDGTQGRRGVVLLTEQSDLVAHVRHLLDRDTEPRWGDLVAWNPLDTVYGHPPSAINRTASTAGPATASRRPPRSTPWPTAGSCSNRPRTACAVATACSAW